MGRLMMVNEIIVKISQNKTIINGVTYYLHPVKKGENLYRISLAYGVKQDVIISMNPDIASGNIKEGQILKIPASSNEIATQTDNYKQNYTKYKVRRHDTEFSIAKKHSVSLEDLNLANPSANLLELKTGQVIYIPEIKRIEVTQKTVNSVKDSTIVLTQEKPDIPCNNYVNKNNTICIALLIPFFLDENQSHFGIDSLMEQSEQDKKADEANDKYKRSLNFIEFYQGALLAIDSLRKKPA